MVLESYSMLHADRASALQAELHPNHRLVHADYAEALDLLQADAVVFQHKLAASDRSVAGDHADELSRILEGLRGAAQELNESLALRPTFAGSYRCPDLAEAFGHTRLYGTAPRAGLHERAQDALDDAAYLNGALRVTAHLAMSAGDVVMAGALTARADQLEGFSWVLAAWLH